jgi:hypothetical protein
VELGDPSGQRCRDGRDVGRLGSTGGDDDRSRTPPAMVGVDDETARRSAQARDGDVFEDRCADVLSVADEAVDERIGGEVATRVDSAAVLAGKLVHPVGGQESE